VVFYGEEKLFKFREFVYNRNNFSHYDFRLRKNKEVIMKIDGEYVSNQN